MAARRQLACICRHFKRALPFNARRGLTFPNRFLLLLTRRRRLPL